MTLFKSGEFLSHSGIQLPFKIDCDALGDQDWEAIARIVADRLIFNEVYGVPKGGTPFACALKQFKKPYMEPHVRRPRMLIVDDVLTTGTSMEVARKQWNDTHSCQGVVLFARDNWPYWIWPVFTLAPIFRKTN